LNFKFCYFGINMLIIDPLLTFESENCFQSFSKSFTLIYLLFLGDQIKVFPFGIQLFEIFTSSEIIFVFFYIKNFCSPLFIKRF
jgi:hypothetical protein